MLKTKNLKPVLAFMVIFSMMAVYGYSPVVKAASLESLKDTVSNSDFGETATHNIVLDMTDTNPLTPGEYINVEFQSEFDTINVDNMLCPVGMASSTVGAQILRCTVNAGEFLHATTTQTIIITGVTNPTEVEGNGDYDLTVTTYDSGDTEIESSVAKVYILDSVTVTAHVDSTLSFAIGTSTPYDGAINGFTPTGTSSPNSIPFGNIDPESQYIMGQTLTVSTNADSGYVVTVQQDENMTNGAAADIDPYSTGATTTWPVDVTSSLNINDENTYGYMALTTDDSDYMYGDGFQGFDGTSAIEVLSHDGPADGSTQDMGLARVAYSIEITDLQEAGDYANSLTYICTPTY